MYWDMVYGYLARLLAGDACVRAAARVVRFEALCDAPAQTLRDALEHCALPEAEAVVAQHAGRIRRPAYYTKNLSSRDLEVIQEHTAATARLWGY